VFTDPPVSADAVIVYVTTGATTTGVDSGLSFEQVNRNRLINMKDNFLSMLIFNYLNVRLIHGSLTPCSFKKLEDEVPYLHCFLTLLSPIIKATSRFFGGVLRDLIPLLEV